MSHTMLTAVFFLCSVGIAQERDGWTETFDGPIQRPFIAYPPERWTVGEEHLEAEHYAEGSGRMIFLWDDRLYNSELEQLTIKVTFHNNEWIGDQERVGLIFAGDLQGGTYYAFVINLWRRERRIGQTWVHLDSPEWNQLFSNGAQNEDERHAVVPEGVNTVEMRYTDRWRAYINDISLTVGDEGFDDIPALQGRIGVYVYDSVTDADRPNTSFIHSFSVEYDKGAFDGGGITAFLRADTTEDEEVNISDPIRTLATLFETEDTQEGGGASISCFDSADANDDGVVDISDVVFTLFFLFNNGDGRFKLFPPYYGGKGIDLTPDAINCN